MAFADGKILAEIKDGVGRITFNQPEKRNAMSVAMWDGMGQALDVFAADASVRCVVLTGAGDKAFVSGADISQFGIPAAKLGIAYGFDMVKHLVSLVGPAHAHMILMTGERFDAREAERVGLINKVVPADQLGAEVSKITATLAQNAPLSLFANKRTVQAVLQDRADRDMAAIQADLNACFDSADYKEGRQAFMEKRKPAFQGR